MTKDEKAAYWRRRVDGFLTSGLSVKNYCAQEGIAVGTLHYWRKRFVDAVEMRPMINETEGFLLVTLTPARPSVSPVETFSCRQLATTPDPLRPLALAIPQAAIASLPPNNLSLVRRQVSE